jgi:hypothetical protein
MFWQKYYFRTNTAKPNRPLVQCCLKAALNKRPYQIDYAFGCKCAFLWHSAQIRLRTTAFLRNTVVLPNLAQYPMNPARIIPPFWYNTSWKVVVLAFLCVRGMRKNRWHPHTVIFATWGLRSNLQTPVGRWMFIGIAFIVWSRRRWAYTTQSCLYHWESTDIEIDGIVAGRRRVRHPDKRRRRWSTESPTSR